MSELHTPRLTLSAIDVVEAQRILSGLRTDGDAWASDFPFEGDLVALTMFLKLSSTDGDPYPFGHYLITRRRDRLAIGGIGFKGAPVKGGVEVGYGLVPSARGEGLAAEALTALMAHARGLGVTRVRAEVTPDNVASRRTLEKSGLTLVASDEELCRYEVVLGPSSTGTANR